MKVNWKGVIPAITTPFNADLSVDEGFLAKHSRWMVDEGSVGLVPVGSLGESATLDRAEKRKVIETCVKAVGDRVPIIPGIAALSTAEAVKLAQDAKAIGCSGLMVLPPYVYSTDWREMKAHVRAIIAATDLPCMLYNNPIAYKTDFLPQHIVELAGELAQPARRQGIERRPAARDGDSRAGGRARADPGRRRRRDRRSHRCGRDRMDRGTRQRLPRRVGRALPVCDGRTEGRGVRPLRWFLPLLRLDTVVKFVQLIKLVQQRVGMGSDRVRPPRLPLAGEELREANAVIDRALATRPKLAVEAASTA